MRLYSYASSGNCLKVRMLLGALDVDYELVEVDIFAGETLTDAFGRLNPLRETPVLELTDGSALTQSNAILSYLAEGTDWAGRTRRERAQVAAWGYFEQERIMSTFGGARFRLMTGRATAQELARRVAIGQAALDVMQARLSAHTWLVGSEPTIADLALYPYTAAAAEVGFDLGRWAPITRWLAHVRELRGVVDDWVPYPANARAGAGRSIYD
jgi:glutathione S-transferase